MDVDTSVDPNVEYQEWTVSQIYETLEGGKREPVPFKRESWRKRKEPEPQPQPQPQPSKKPKLEAHMKPAADYLKVEADAKSMLTHSILHPPPKALERYNINRDVQIYDTPDSVRHLFRQVVEHNIKLPKGTLADAEVKHLRDYAKVLASGSTEESIRLMALAAGQLTSALEDQHRLDEEDLEVFEQMKKSLDEGSMSMIDFNTFLQGQRMNRLEREKTFKVEKKVELQDGKWRLGRRISPKVTMWQDLDRAPTEVEKATAKWDTCLYWSLQLLRKKQQEQQVNITVLPRHTS